MSVGNAAKLLSISRGQPSNPRYPETFRNAILDIVREHYHDFGPTLAREKLRSVQRTEIVNERLDDVLAFVAEMQSGRELQRSKSGPRRAGQTNHMFALPDGSQSNGYQKRKPRGRTDYMNDPEVIARRKKALARIEAAE
ncbi:hypothetical protein FHW16_005621 [Phyllobacterium myrsinacearum]|uniref:ISNCY family transposase n=1 Tax=Phyllobacterium myrsinacearum TaxID=28101 RepID=A0A839EWH4_9HYPH|nr:hypothetical protein [Phyllobacterium myrsinacearum]